MRFVAFATDYDETLAGHGVVLPETLRALERIKASGRKLLLVTGRDLEDLKRVFPGHGVFDAIVAENGAVLHRPHDGSVRMLGEPPPARFVEALRAHRVQPLSVGRVIVATRVPYETLVVEEIRRFGLELQVIFNKGAVMVLPGGVNKGSGVRAALAELCLSPHNCVAVGDAENDHVFLSEVELGAAVANALPGLKERADVVLRGAAEHGVVELIEAVLADDLRSLASRTSRRNLVLGEDEQGRRVAISPAAGPLLFTGTGAAAAADRFVDRVVEAEYQCCIVGDRGGSERSARAVRFGDSGRPPTVDEVVRALEEPRAQIVVDSRAVPPRERPSFLGTLLSRLDELRSRSGRPHWIAIDCARDLPGGSLAAALPPDPYGIALVADVEDDFATAALERIQLVVATTGTGTLLRVRPRDEPLRR